MHEEHRAGLGARRLLARRGELDGAGVEGAQRFELDLDALARDWPLILLATVLVVGLKAAITGALLRASGAPLGVAVETGVSMASPSETTLIVLSAAAGVGLLSGAEAGFWRTVTAIGLTVTPLLAAVGRRIGREVQALHAIGLTREEALGAASWRARRWLGRPAGLGEGDPADFVVLDADPLTDLRVLEAPLRVVLRGRVVV